jgi:hypothetical protein
MSCNNLIGIPYGCNDDIGVGGISRALVFDMSDIDQEVFQTSPTASNAGFVTTLTLATASVAEEYIFKRNTANHTTTPNIDLINGSTFYTQVVNLMFSKRMASKSVSLQLLAEGQRYLGLVYQDANGLWWYVRDLQLTGGDETSGQAKADNSKYEVVLTAETILRSYQIDEANALALL